MSQTETPTATKADAVVSTKPVHITFVVDRSGSMSSLRSDVIGGFNSFLAEQKAQPGKCRLTVHQFDSNGFDTIFDAEKIAKVRDVTDADFIPRGSTPLLDAVGRSITEATVRAEKRKAAGKDEEAQVFIILTDGLENCSHEYTRDKLKALIASKEAEGWAFTYLGANQDAYMEAQAMGFDPAATQNFAGDGAGMAAAMSNVSGMTSSHRHRTAGGVAVASAALYSEVGKTAEEDYEERAVPKHGTGPVSKLP